MGILAARMLVLGGACVLIAAVIPIMKLYRCLRPGKVRVLWLMLLALTVFFVLGYAAYGIIFLRDSGQSLDLIVPSIFFSGSIFVLLSSFLSLRTAIDVRKIIDLEHESVTDPLTGIFNRRYLERRLQEEFSRAKRFQLPLSILLVDLDNFKRVNDTYGHLAGDSALVSFTQLISQAIRPTDVVARWGGDEFMIVATNTPDRDAYQLAELIRASAESNVLEMVGSDKRIFTVQVSVSIGVSCYCDRFESLAEFVESVDQMMYSAKREGRNRTVVWEDCLIFLKDPPAKEIQYTLDVRCSERVLE
jgi:diguanylate cyclase (GGDEF)-like protein